MGLGGNPKQKEVANRYCTGIDLSKKTSFITTIDEDGKMVTEPTSRMWKRTFSFFIGVNEGM